MRLRILASAFGVAVAFALALVETSAPLAAGHRCRGLGGGALILFFAVLIPQSPVATLVVGLAVAATWSAAYAINAGARSPAA